MNRSVLVVRLDNLGDVLLAGPAVRAIARTGARVTFLTSTRSRAAAELLPGVDRVLTFDAPWVAYDPPAFDRVAALELVGRLSGLGLDQSVVLTSFHQSPLPTALLLRLARVPFVAATSADYPGSLLDVRHEVPDAIHEVERSLSLVRSLGYDLAPDDDARLRIVEAPPAGDGGVRIREELAEPYVVVHPGASVPARAWDPKRYAEVVGRLELAGWRVVVTGTTSEKERCASVAAGGSNALDLSGCTGLRELADVLEGAAAVVVGNTGPAHLAAAVGTPVVSVYAPTVPAVRWRPWGVAHVVLGAQDIDCAGCRCRDCPFDDHPCLGGVGTGDVVDAVTRLALEREARR